ncbi:MAG: MerR family transcriptional regulator [Candidatus Oxydemutatoraceae bacterium WSBS_2016_MAG_OTU14]
MHTKHLKKIDPERIPDKRYFTIGEISRLCRVEQHVLRYWEQEFSALKPVRRGNRRYYQQHDIYLVRQISDLLRRQRYTIDGARRQLTEGNSKTERVYSKQIVNEICKMIEEVQSILKA